MKHLAILTSVLLSVNAYAKGDLNLIYIITDQQTAGAMSCAGNGDIHTPNLDRLAARGVRFLNAYCSSPLSGPSRGAMFTGYYPSELNMSRNGAPMPETVKGQSLGILLKDNGYDCVYGGKWHVHTNDIPDDEFGFKNIHKAQDYQLAESAVDYLKNRKKGKFFMVVSYVNPHNICEYARKQNLPDIAIEEPRLDDCPNIPSNFAINPYDAGSVQYEKSMSYKLYPTRDYTIEDWRRYINAYYRMVEGVDRQLGKILDELDRQHLWDDTAVIFTSDHGDGVGAHHWNQKSALYEEVVNIPLIMCMPKGKNSGKTASQLVNNGPDLFATICDMTGVKLPDALSGCSFKPVSEQLDFPLNDYVVTETLFDNGETKGWALRTAHYKYVLYDKGTNREQLFDMDKDRGEMRNLVVEAKYRAVLEVHRRRLNEWMDKHHVAQMRLVRYVPDNQTSNR